MTDETDDQFLTLDDVIGWIRNLMALVGMVATSVAIGLHHSGFFTWLFSLK